MSNIKLTVHFELKDETIWSAYMSPEELPLVGDFIIKDERKYYVAERRFLLEPEKMRPADRSVFTNVTISIQ